jgi:hypothetical protein
MLGDFVFVGLFQGLNRVEAFPEMTKICQSYTIISRPRILLTL